MSNKDEEELNLESHEIISPVPHVNWLVQSGPVRKGQLLGIGSESGSNKVEESKIAETTKHTIIRARKIKRKVPAVSSSSSSVKNEVPPLATKITAEDEEDRKTSFLSKYIDTGESSQSVLKREDVTSSTDRKSSTSSPQFEIRSISDGIIHLFQTPRNKQVDNTENTMVYVMGTVQPCNHPAIIDGLCVLCGQSTNASHDTSTGIHNDDDDDGNTKKRNALTLTGGVTVSISSEYGQTFSNETAQSLRASRKLNLVLDLDHTLLHATPDPRAKKWLSKSDELRTVHLPMMEGNPFQQNVGYAFQPHYIKLRPHLAEFMISVMDKYEVSIYTAGTRLYAEKIADVISRHVAHYLKFSNKEKDDIGYMDEMEIQMLRDEVLHLKDRVSWYKSKKERQEYVDRMNKEAESEEANDIKEGKYGDEMTNLEESDRKRKRVTFDVNFDKKSEVDDDHDLPLILMKKESQLKVAEEREEEVQGIRKKIFGSRIISRTDVGDLGLNVKSLKRAFPCGGMMAVIVDDREDVWANAENNSTGRKGEPPDNLLFIRPYHWAPFLKYADVNNAAGEDLTQQVNGKDDENNDSLDESGEQYLLWTADVLNRIHSKYYDPKINEEDRNELTVPSILKRMRSSIFTSENQSIKILLSGLVPIDKQDRNSGYTSQPRPHVIRYAEEMGAKVVPDVTPDLTYVVAARDGTDKILRARKIPGCAILSVAFLMDCYWKCMKLDIEKYTIGARPKPIDDESAATRRSILLTGSDSSEDEDEDFVNAFEKEMKG